MIVGRRGELARLDDLLLALRRGEGSAMVVHGEAGMGKTTLLDALVARAGDPVTVLRVCAAETEAHLTFAVLADLLQPPALAPGQIVVSTEWTLSARLILDGQVTVTCGPFVQDQFLAVSGAWRSPKRRATRWPTRWDRCSRSAME